MSRNDRDIDSNAVNAIGSPWERSNEYDDDATHADDWIRVTDELPPLNQVVEGLGDGAEVIDCRYVEERQCMLAGIGGGNGYLGPGFEDVENGLVVDVTHWRPRSGEKS